MWTRGGYTNHTSSSNITSDNSNGSGANDQFCNPMSMSAPADYSFNLRRLRPLIPKPSTSSTIPTLPPCLNHGSCDTTSNDFFPLNHHMATSQSHHHLMGVGEQGRRDQFNGHQSVVVSSRWNPTPEQLRALEELYRRGTRTPSAAQIQHITAQLRRYGKIEGKNVFYWFQNHKARERQKRRRQQLENSSSPNDQQQSQDHHHHDHQTKELPAPGDESNHNDNKGSATAFEIEYTKLWVAPINCSTPADQESVHKSDKAAASLAAECATYGEWIQLQDHHNSLQIPSTTMFQDIADEHRRKRTSLNLLAKNITWDNTHHSPITSSFTKPTVMVQTSMANKAGDYEDDLESNNQEEALTLELFPLQSSGAMDVMKQDDGEEKGTHLTSCQFFHFLPLKNNTAY